MRSIKELMEFIGTEDLNEGYSVAVLTPDGNKVPVIAFHYDENDKVMFIKCDPAPIADSTFTY